MSTITKVPTGQGRKPLSAIERTTRRIVRAHAELVEVEQEFNMMLGLSNPSKPNKRDKEILNIAEIRLKINTTLNRVLKDVYPLQRMKAEEKTTEAKDTLKTMVAKRDRMFADLKDIPELGATEDEWAKMTTEEKARGLGRPKVSLELRVVRARLEFKEADAEYREAEEEAGVEHTDIEKLVKLRAGSFSGPGRPSGGMLTQLERKLRTLNKDIEHITSGAAAIDVEARRQKQMQTTHGKRMGRPFESLEDRLIRFRAEEKQLVEQISVLEINLTDTEWLQRKTGLTRKAVKAQTKLLDSLNLNPDEDSNEPEVQKLYQIEALLYKYESMKEDGIQRTEEPMNIKITEIGKTAEISKVVDAPKAKKAPEIVASAPAQTSAPKSLEEIKRLAQKVQESKMKAASTQNVKTMESAKKGKEKIKQSETEALMSIVSNRKNG